MMRSRRLLLAAFALTMSIPAAAVFAQPPPAERGAIPVAPQSPCDFPIPAPERHSPGTPDTFQLLTGYLQASGIGPNPRWDVDYVPLTARFGWYLTDPLAPRAISLQLDYTTSIITTSFGHCFTGPSLLVRGECRPDRALVPYVQAGVGVLLNDVY